MISVNSFGLKHMGDKPACIECKGKFGCALYGKVCEICGLVIQLQNHLTSPRYPAEEKEVALRYVRECFHKVLEHSDTYWGAKGLNQGPFPEVGGSLGEGSQPSKEAEVKSERPLIAVKEEKEEKVDKGPLEEPQAARGGVEISLSSPSVTPPGLTGKAAPQKPPRRSKDRELRETPRKKGKEESSSRGRSRQAEKEKKKKRKRKSRSGQSRSESRRRRRRRRSGEVSEPPVEGPRKRVEEPERRKVRPSTIPSSSARGAQPPRSPSKGPANRPERGYYQEPFWSGPIPAGRRPREHSPQQKNKGLKKKRQQERARTFGWKFHDGRRWR